MALTLPVRIDTFPPVFTTVFRLLSNTIFLGPTHRPRGIISDGAHIIYKDRSDRNAAGDFFFKKSKRGREGHLAYVRFGISTV